MADKNPYGSLGLGQMGSERSVMYQGGPISDALKGLKTGLIMQAAKKSGLTGFLNNFGISQDDNSGTFKYKTPSAGAPIVPPDPVVPAAPAIPAAVAPVDATTAPTNVAPAQTTQPAPDVDKQIDSVWKTSDLFEPRNASQDQLPQQFAAGPVAPPMMNIPQAQIPQSSGTGQMLLNMAFG